MAEAKKTKDKMMAARMKQEGVTRKTGKCPICNRAVNLKGMYSHIVTHGG